jgi:site-specific DNA-methyltransferase (adenine-specific)
MESKQLIIIGDARRMPELEDESVHLIVTSPPYFNVKDYGTSKGNIGAFGDYYEYLKALHNVFSECYRVLDEGRCICVNVSDVISSDQKYPIPFHILPILERAGFRYRDDIIWKKPSGVGQNAGGGAAKRFGVFLQNPYPMYYYPNNIYEHVLIFRKGKFDYKKIPKEKKTQAKFDLEQARQYLNCDVWEIAPATQNQFSKDAHPAMFPEVLPATLISLFTYPGETVLDPFLGSGTTLRAARRLGRLGVGYEVNKAYLPLIKRKVGFSEEDFEIITRGGERNE